MPLIRKPLFASGRCRFLETPSLPEPISSSPPPLFRSCTHTCARRRDLEPSPVTAARPDIVHAPISAPERDYAAKKQRKKKMQLTLVTVCLCACVPAQRFAACVLKRARTQINTAKLELAFLAFSYPWPSDAGACRRSDSGWRFVVWRLSSASLCILFFSPYQARLNQKVEPRQGHGHQHTSPASARRHHHRPASRAATLQITWCSGRMRSGKRIVCSTISAQVIEGDCQSVDCLS